MTPRRELSSRRISRARVTVQNKGYGMRRIISRTGGVSVLALALAAPLLIDAPAWAQTAQPQSLPYDAERGVFTFATDLERALPAVVQVTTLGQSEGPSSGDNEPRPMASGLCRWWLVLSIVSSKPQGALNF